MQGKSSGSSKKRAFTPGYISPKQLTIEGFETPFEQNLIGDNRWVKLAHSIPWDAIVGPYNKLFRSKEGRPPISGRVILGAIIIKHMGNFTDRETVAQISENPYMQYFLGYSRFIQEEPFSHTLFVEVRERLSVELLARINEIITVNYIKEELSKNKAKTTAAHPNSTDDAGEVKKGSSKDNVDGPGRESESTAEVKVENRGKLLVDAIVTPQNITFPTYLKLVDAARKKSEQIIDRLYCKELHGEIKPRTYRKVARKIFFEHGKEKEKNSLFYTNIVNYLLIKNY